MFNQPSAGKTVYGNGSFAPNRGQVSAQGAQGYLKRSLQQNTRQQRPPFQTPGINPGFNGVEGRRVGAMRIGGDGQSDTRSGLAQAAMQRAQGMFGHGQTPGTKPPMFNQEPKPPAGNGGGGGGQQVPQVKIGANGQIEMPYDAGYNQQVYGDLADFNNQLMGLQQGQQVQAQQYAQQMRDENLGFQGRQKMDLAGDAAHGMAFSSKYATDVGNTYGAHQNSVNDLDSANANYNSQVAAQRASIQDNFNRELQQAAADRAANADSKAGSLGYGNKDGHGGAGGHNSDNRQATGHGGKYNGGKGSGNGGRGGKQTPGTKPNTEGGGHTIHINIHNNHPRPPKGRK